MILAHLKREKGVYMEQRMFVAALIAGVIVLFLLFSFAEQKRRLWKLKQRMRYYYGKNRDIVLSDEVLSVIGAYSRTKETMIDEITWNDLDLDSVFMEINHTWSFAGEDYLYFLLHIPKEFPISEEEQEELITYYQSNEKERMDMQLEFAGIGKNHSSSVYVYILDSIRMNGAIPWLHYGALLFLVVSLLYTVAAPLFGVGLLITCIVVNILVHVYTGKRVDISVQALQYFLNLHTRAGNLLKKNLICSDRQRKMIERNYKALKKRIGSTAFIRRGAAGESLTDMVMDYVRMITHVDYIMFYKCVRGLEKSMDMVEDLIAAMGILECMIAIGSMREWFPHYCVPEFTKEPVLDIVDACHPALADPVPNSIYAEKGVLITGSNASGKSTFLKTVAINAVLGQALHTCLARQYKGAWFQIFSSMAVRDSLSKGESYYIAEIKALKRIFDRQGEEPVLCFVDEVLRGTNTVERIAASTQVLKELQRRKILCFAATHDIELTYLLEAQYENYHFQEQVSEQKVVFDYKLFEGRSNSRNAIRLLEILGYDEAVISEAQKMVDGFLQTGKW